MWALGTANGTEATAENPHVVTTETGRETTGRPSLGRADAHTQTELAVLGVHTALLGCQTIKEPASRKRTYLRNCETSSLQTARRVRYSETRSLLQDEFATARRTRNCETNSLHRNEVFVTPPTSSPARRVRRVWY